jgi:hemolysin III
MAEAVHPRDLLRPRMRGWLHAYAFLVSLVTGTVVTAVTPGGERRLGAGIYALTVAMLFGTSALYHRITWQPGPRAIMKRLDHAMIFVFIAGTYTPFALTVLSPTSKVVVLIVIWSGAAVGIGTRMAWLQAPRPLIVPLYIALGWVAVFVLPQILHNGGVAALVLLLVGGLFYSLGAVVYAVRRPDPVPAVFGYHEVFHLCTLLAAICHYIAIYFALFS